MAAAWADQQVAAVRDDPDGRLALMQRCYYGPFGKAPGRRCRSCAGSIHPSRTATRADRAKYPARQALVQNATGQPSG